MACLRGIDTLLETIVSIVDKRQYPIIRNLRTDRFPIVSTYHQSDFFVENYYFVNRDSSGRTSQNDGAIKVVVRACLKGGLQVLLLCYGNEENLPAQKEKKSPDSRI